MLVYYKDKVWVKEHRCLFIIKTKCGLKSIDVCLLYRQSVG